MFSINQYVYYDGTGVCKIIDIKKEKFMNETKEYYVLKPIYQDKSTIHVPIDNEQLTSRIEPVIEVEELNALISKIPDIKAEWIENDNERNTAFKNAIHSGDRIEIIKILKTLHSRKSELDKKGKHLRVADAQIMNEAERILYNEIALVVNIDPDEVLTFLYDRLGKVQ